MAISKNFLLSGLMISAVASGALWYAKTDDSPSETHPEKIFENDAVMIMSAEGFSPEKITVTVGATVRFINKDALGHWPASDLHPTHGLYPEFDPHSVIKPGDEWSFKFEKPGSWPIHDHVAPYITGKIIVVN